MILDELTPTPEQQRKNKQDGENISNLVMFICFLIPPLWPIFFLILGWRVIGKWLGLR